MGRGVPPLPELLPTPEAAGHWFNYDIIPPTIVVIGYTAIDLPAKTIS